jgi:hypothetical protein
MGLLDTIGSIFKRKKKTYIIDHNLWRTVEKAKNRDLNEANIIKSMSPPDRIGRRLEYHDSLPDYIEIQSALVEINEEDVASFKWYNSEKIVNEIKNEFDNEILKMKGWLKELENISKEDGQVIGNELEYDVWDISEMQEILKKEIVRTEKELNDCIRYADLTERALNSYVASFHDRLPSPEFTVQDCDELIELTWKYDNLSLNKFERFGLVNIAKIREKLGMPESSRINELLEERKREIELVRKNKELREREEAIPELKERWKKIQKYDSLREKFDSEIEYSLRNIGKAIDNELPDVLLDDVQKRESLRKNLFKFIDDEAYFSSRNVMKNRLNDILSYEERVAEVNPPKSALVDFPDCSRKKAEIEREFAEAERIYASYAQYRKLARRAVDQYICHGSELSPQDPTPLIKADFAELKRLHKEFRGSDEGLKNIEKMERVVLKQAKSVEIGQAAITEKYLETGNTLQGKRGFIQESLGENKWSRWSSIRAEKAANARRILAEKAPDKGGR